MQTYLESGFSLGPVFVHLVNRFEFDPASDNDRKLIAWGGIVVGTRRDWSLSSTVLCYIFWLCAFWTINLRHPWLRSFSATLLTGAVDYYWNKFRSVRYEGPLSMHWTVRPIPCCPCVGFLTGTMSRAHHPTQYLMVLVTAKQPPTPTGATHVD